MLYDTIEHNKSRNDQRKCDAIYNDIFLERRVRVRVRVRVTYVRTYRTNRPPDCVGSGSESSRLSSTSSSAMHPLGDQEPLCYVMLCYVMSCCVMLFMLCHVLLCSFMLCYVLYCSVTQ